MLKKLANLLTTQKKFISEQNAILKDFKGFQEVDEIQKTLLDQNQKLLAAGF